ncbi:pyridoxine 5'-phosphate synthase [Prochlorococcus sp. MIT 1300]|uniref:pyridoxine 5'-phosphate synthase n=1 Tax=Prochlorococcus sp. MIT 1300 TaxID=3096218 RepID=UPI002A755E48|nr:pyridoxine 5'-phosphate synthase [Prochlorococcus sp. MIT 1300]
MAKLGVNIDHIASVRQARRTVEPDPVNLAFIAELGGADSITVHLREDRRHIQDRDVRLLRKTIRTQLNLEMAPTDEMVNIALNVCPDMVTLVPERREEITTEGGLDIIVNQIYIKEVISKLQDESIPVSLFVDPSYDQIQASADTGADFVELHTGCYAEASTKERVKQLSLIKEATAISQSLGLGVNAGHGLTYQNVSAIAEIRGIQELNIGHTIIARSLAVGLKEAVQEMKALISGKGSNYIRNHRNNHSKEPC